MLIGFLCYYSLSLLVVVVVVVKGISINNINDRLLSKRNCALMKIVLIIVEINYRKFSNWIIISLVCTIFSYSIVLKQNHTQKNLKMISYLFKKRPNRSKIYFFCFNKKFFYLLMSVLFYLKHINCTGLENRKPIAITFSCCVHQLQLRGKRSDEWIAWNNVTSLNEEKKGFSNFPFSIASHTHSI